MTAACRPRLTVRTRWIPGPGVKALSDKHTPEQNQAQLLEVQAALFNLRDGLMNLKLSLQELAFMTDENVQRQAQAEADCLFMRLRG